MRHGHQASADRAKAVPTQQVESQGPQQRYHLDSVALAVVVYVLAELGVAGPVPLAFDCPRSLSRIDDPPRSPQTTEADWFFWTGPIVNL
jgi:hypothetical protein